MRNKVRENRTINYKPTTDPVKGGDLVVFPGMVAVAATDIAVDGLGACEVFGVYALPKKAGEAIAQGVRVYVDNGEITATESTTVVGVTWEDAAAGDETANVGINI